MDIRIDPITGDPVAYATRRAQRPRSKGKADPFAPGNEALTGAEIFSLSDNPNHKPDQPGWKIRVVPNTFPISDRHEVIILSPDGHKDIDRMSLRQVERVIETYVCRFKALQPAGQVFLFCNHGPDAGASIAHPHAQIMALPALPPSLKRKVEAIQTDFKDSGNCRYCRMVEHELALAKRVVWQGEDFVLLCPEASAWPYQLQLLPKIHQAQFAQVRLEEMTELATALQLMVRLYNIVLDRPAYNYWINSVKGNFFHWHLDMIPRIKVLAGVELGAGLAVNDRITPEQAAVEFRQLMRAKN